MFVFIEVQWTVIKCWSEIFDINMKNVIARWLCLIKPATNWSIIYDFSENGRDISRD